MNPTSTSHAKVDGFFLASMSNLNLFNSVGSSFDELFDGFLATRARVLNLLDPFADAWVAILVHTAVERGTSGFTDNF